MTTQIQQAAPLKVEKKSRSEYLNLPDMIWQVLAQWIQLGFAADCRHDATVLVLWPSKR